MLTDRLGFPAAACSPERYLDELRSRTPPARHMPCATAFDRPAEIAAVTGSTPSVIRSGNTVQVCGGANG
ncbi:hypothetical protein [Streptomyces nitrosporeus]|uniref:hypothetical protein n=1 Tax=Streptomyces nitrosporeus TaxID=28894 RepID=UPI00167DC77D|nr:hypothetical protein [Streptomyces nitrosporeus]GGZ03353.1 hypothetical protein GCM10010327_37480 [Streptomyces nitrosporeus]